MMSNANGHSSLPGSHLTLRFRDGSTPFKTRVGSNLAVHLEDAHPGLFGEADSPHEAFLQLRQSTHTHTDACHRTYTLCPFAR